MAFEHYLFSDGKRRRCGFTTGTCAALAAAGAARKLLLGRWPDTVRLRTPKGLVVEVPLEDCRLEGDAAVCGVRKDGGDDVDQTTGALIVASVSRTDPPGITILGGPGVGRVTKPGLDQPVGSPAINRIPRQMIRQELETLCRESDYRGGLTVTISVPEGARIAEKTFNPHLGIQGGISILGTSGIVEPMSLTAMADSLRLELRQLAAQGERNVILTPGNYGMDFLRHHGLDKLGVPVVKCSNFIGEALDQAAEDGMEGVLLVGHAGKLVKLAGGILNTHSRYGDCRTELFCAHAAVCGADQATCRALLESATTDACLAILEQAGLRQAVLDRLLTAIHSHLTRRVGGRYPIGAILFSNQFGELGRTPDTQEVLQRWQQKQELSMG